MRALSGVAVAAVLSCVSSASLASTEFDYIPAENPLILAPAYDAAIYGTPDAPLYWSAPSFDDVRQVAFATLLSDLKISFKVKDATPGALVVFGNSVGVIGVVAGDGTFSSGPVATYRTYYDMGWDWLRIGNPWPAGAIHKDLFSIYDIQISGFAPRTAPEPATWALLILGFGFTGVALRRRRAFA
jgi:hypothetical protein